MSVKNLKRFKKMKRKVAKRKSRKRNLRHIKTSHKKSTLDRVILSAWSRAVRNRDKLVCLSCGSKTKLHAHHMVSKYYIPKHAYNINNGITLCKSCHTGVVGVHGKGKPKTDLVSQLRSIYLSRDVARGALLLRRLGTIFTKDIVKVSKRDADVWKKKNRST